MLDLIEALHLRGPLIQAPLSGGPSTPGFVAAASNAGALGSLGAAYMSPEKLEQNLQMIRQMTQKPFAVNLFVPAQIPLFTAQDVERAIAATAGYRHDLGLATPAVNPPFAEDFDAQFNAVLEAKPAVFSFTFGLIPEEVINACRARGILTIGTATSLDEGLALQDSGVDAVTAQGLEAGGHHGVFTAGENKDRLGTMELVKILVAKLSIPVIAAGGIMDGAGIKAALKAGAQAAQLGTAFLACADAGTSAPYRAALLAKGEKKTRITKVFSGRYARGIENKFMTEMEGKENSLLPFPVQNSFTRDIRNKAAECGLSDYLSLWAGSGVDGIREMPVRQLVDTLLAELAAAAD